MKSPKLKALIALYVFMMTMGLVQSCCEEEYIITGGGELTAYDSLGVRIDTVRGGFSLGAAFITERALASQLFTGFGNSAYATSCATVFRNSIVEDSFTLTLDKAFIFDGDTIASGVNILDFEHVEELFSSDDFLGDFGSIALSNNFFRMSEFERGDYTFTLNGRTTDDVILNSSVELYVNL